MAQIILHPTNPNYCKECIYHNEEPATCTNKNYIENQYKVNCVWKYCPYKKIRGSDEK